MTKEQYIDAINAYILGGCYARDVDGKLALLNDEQINSIYSTFKEYGYSLDDVSEIDDDEYDNIVLELANKFAE